MLETAWEELDPAVREKLLWGTGDEHITFTWRSGPSGYKWGGKFEGIIPKLLSQYRSTRSRMQRRQLEKYMRDHRLQRLRRAAAQSAGPGGHAHTRRRRLCREAPADAAGSLRAGRDRRGASSSASWSSTPRGRPSPPRCSRKSAAGCGFLINVGLDYLTLDRTAPTLSGGEMQRIRLAGQIGCGLVGVLYILDEPSIGLHPRDNDRLLETLAQLRDLGNTVVVVEHDEDTMRAADHIVDFGPGPGVRGGAGGGRRPGRRDRPPAAKASPGSTSPAPARSRFRPRRRPVGPTEAASIRGARTTISRTSTSRSRWASSSA